MYLFAAKLHNEVLMNQENTGRVLAVIPNYNGGEHVLKCIRSVLDQSYPDIEIIVVDNQSTDGSRKALSETFPELRIIDTGRNAGWGIACNIGMKAASSAYIALLNNDAYLDRDCISAMVRAIEKKPEYGSCASRILLWDTPETAEVCGLVIHKDGSSCGRGRLGPADQYMESEEVFCANDCCCLYKRAMIEDIGDYDPDFFIYCDETDIGWKHQIAGWKCIYEPRAVAYHAHSRTAGSYSPFKAYHVERNRIFICIKYFPLFLLAASFFRAAWRYGLQCYLSAVKKKGALAHFRREHSLLSGLAILLRAHRDALMKWPVMRARHKEIMKKKRITNQELADLFRRYGISTREMAEYE